MQVLKAQPTVLRYGYIESAVLSASGCDERCFAVNFYYFRSVAIVAGHRPIH